MNKEIIGLSRALAIMAVMGWFSDTLASVALHRGWGSLAVLLVDIKIQIS